MNHEIMKDIESLTNYVYTLIQLNEDSEQKDVWNAITKLATAIEILNIQVHK